jgi:hypothetical protein
MGPQIVANLLTTNSALQMAVNAIAGQTGQVLPPIANNQIVITTISPDLADKNAQLTYPRVCLYTTQVKNTHLEKFRSFSGVVAVATDVSFSASLIASTETGLHCYVDAIGSILRANQGDLGNGFYFSGLYDVQPQAAKPGGFGFVESARITCVFDVSIT